VKKKKKIDLTKYKLRYQCQLKNAIGEDFKEKIEKLRKDLNYVIQEQGLVYIEVAYKADTHISTISDFCTGKRKIISLNTYEKLKKFVDKRLEKLEKK